MSQPKFSIVIPTRNRSSLLGYAIQSALAQNGDDFEVVVSVNSTDRQTFAAVQKLANLRSKR